MAQFTIIKQEDLQTINQLNKLKKDNSYRVLNEFNGYSTIIQYSTKYDNFHIVSVPTDKLDETNKY